MHGVFSFLFTVVVACNLIELEMRVVFRDFVPAIKKDVKLSLNSKKYSVDSYARLQ